MGTGAVGTGGKYSRVSKSREGCIEPSNKTMDSVIITHLETVLTGEVLDVPCWQIQAYGCCLKWVTTGNNRPCRDKCFEAPTILKWIVYGALYGTLFFLVQ